MWNDGLKDGLLSDFSDENDDNEGENEEEGMDDGMEEGENGKKRSLVKQMEKYEQSLIDNLQPTDQATKNNNHDTTSSSGNAGGEASDSNAMEVEGEEQSQNEDEAPLDPKDIAMDGYDTDDFDENNLWGSQDNVEKRDMLYFVVSDETALELKRNLWRVLRMTILGLNAYIDNVHLTAYQEDLQQLKYRIHIVNIMLTFLKILESNNFIQFIQNNTQKRCLFYALQSLQSFQSHNNLGNEHTIVYLIKNVSQLLTKHHITKQSIDNENCIICNVKLEFDPKSPFVSHCQHCEITLERCCFTLQLIPSDCNVYQCSLCQSVTSTTHLQQCTDWYNLISDHNPSLLCPFCDVNMKRI